MRVAPYARVSTHDQHILAMQIGAMRELATQRHWTVADTVEEGASGATDHRPKRQVHLKAAKQRQLNVMLVWKLDRSGRFLVDFMTTWRERTAVSVGCVSLTEALGPSRRLQGRAFAGFLAVIAVFERDVIRKRITAGMTDVHQRGKAHGRPRATAHDAAAMGALAPQGFRQAVMARPLGLWRTSVQRVLVPQEGM